MLICLIAVSVIIFYDHLLQLDREVDLVWKRLSFRRISFPTALYFLTRFTLPLAYLLNIDHDLKAIQVSAYSLVFVSYSDSPIVSYQVFPR